MFAKTPSLVGAGACPLGLGLNAGSSVTRRSTRGGDRVAVGIDPTSDPFVLAVLGSALISLCLSSPSFSASESAPSSKVSARSWFALFDKGSWARSRRDVGEESRDRKDGGGEEGSPLWLDEAT